jgi:heptosyltransferase II
VFPSQGEMKNSTFLNLSRIGDKNEQAGRILLKPGAWRHRFSIGAVEAVLRLLVWFFNTPPGNQIGIKRVLVFDPGALGDMVLLAPFVRSLREHLPTTHIAVAGVAGGSLLFEQGLIDEWIQLCVPWGQSNSPESNNIPLWLSRLQLFRSAVGLRKQQIDLAFAVGWGGDLRGNLFIWLTGARRRVGYGYAGGEFLLTDVVPPDLARPHIMDRNLRLLEHLGFPLLDDRETLSLSLEDQEFAAHLLTQHGITREDLVIGIHPRAGSAVREWGDGRFAEVARVAAQKFGAKILWFNDPAKPKPVPANLDAISLTLPFRQFAAVVDRCQLFLCNDSGPMHVAAALKIPVVAVFGPQRPEWFGPYGEGHRVVIRNDVWCRPCGDQCKWKEPYCLSLISVEQVMREVEEALKDVTRKCIEAEARK